MRFKKIVLLLLLIVVLIYVTNITSIPNKIILFNGESLTLNTIFGLKKTREPLITTVSENSGNNIINERKNIEQFERIVENFMPNFVSALKRLLAHALYAL